MNENKLKERLENNFESFFNDQTTDDRSELEFRSEMLLENRFAESGNRNKWRIGNLCRQLFLFFPGAVFLFSFSMMTVYISIIQSYNTVILTRPFALFSLLSAAFFMTWIGLGDLRKINDIVIPGSIAGAGVFIGILSGIASIIDLRLINKILSDSGYPLYFLSLGLIVPFLAKGWIDRVTDKDLA